MINLKKYIYLMLPLLCWACASDVEEAAEQQSITIDGSAFETEIVPFREEGGNAAMTRVSMNGKTFESGDLIRLRVIAPYAPSSEYGESTWGSSYDDWRLFQWSDQANWGTVGSGRGFDIDNDFNPSSAPSTITMPQATPYVFTATTWTEEIHYVLTSTTGSGYESSKVVITFSNVFKADQRDEKNYKASNVLWAQQYMQTGSPHVRLSFEHKMAALMIDISDFESELDKTANAPEVVLTLENMPDIDQQEVAIGNYYVDKMKSKRDYGDYWRCKCSYEDNGKVLGIVVPNEEQGHLVQIPFTSLDQTGVYTALKGSGSIAGTQDGYFYLIIPPYTVPAEVTPTLWLRQGEKRWSAPLSLPNSSVSPTQTDRTFESGIRYHVTMKKPVPDPNPDPTPDPTPDPAPVP